MAGDPTLQICTDTPGNTPAELIYNLHCYRRGGKTQATRKHPLTFCTATTQKIIEHSRWTRCTT
eukprot:8063843-Ditylum_brightwellii.AAC.1